MVYKCPTEPDPEGGDILGCGHVFEATPDEEGLVDCPECGIWFRDPYQPVSPHIKTLVA
jgi:hypothetical protein